MKAQLNDISGRIKSFGSDLDTSSVTESVESIQWKLRDLLSIIEEQQDILRQVVNCLYAATTQKD